MTSLLYQKVFIATKEHNIHSNADTLEICGGLSPITAVMVRSGRDRREHRVCL